MFGIPLLHIVSAALGALGSYNFGRFVITKIENDKAKAAEALKVLHMVEFAADKVEEVYAELKNPATRKAEIDKISKSIHAFIDEANAPAAPVVSQG